MECVLSVRCARLFDGVRLYMNESWLDSQRSTSGSRIDCWKRSGGGTPWHRARRAGAVTWQSHPICQRQRQNDCGWFFWHITAQKPCVVLFLCFRACCAVQDLLPSTKLTLPDMDFTASSTSCVFHRSFVWDHSPGTTLLPLLQHNWLTPKSSKGERANLVDQMGFGVLSKTCW